MRVQDNFLLLDDMDTAMNEECRWLHLVLALHDITFRIYGNNVCGRDFRPMQSLRVDQK